MAGNEISGTQKTLYLKPVGVVKSDSKAPSLQAGVENITLQDDFEKLKERSLKRSGRKAEIIINEGFEELLEGIEGFSHLQVLYWAHKVPEESRKIKKVHPMGRKKNPLTGVFATCSPARPNPILLTAVKLAGREGNVLHVQGLDAVDGSPVIDVKPYVPVYQISDEIKVPYWMEKILKELSNK